MRELCRGALAFERSTWSYALNSVNDEDHSEYPKGDHLVIEGGV